MSNPFMKPMDDYQRDLNLRKATVEQIAKYTALKLNKPYEEVYELVKKEIATNPKMRIKDRPMKYHQRVRNGVREELDISFLQYLDLAINTGRILAPSLTIYRTAEEDKSVTCDWLEVNIAARRKSKSEMLRLGQMGETFQAQLADYDQNARKIRINAVSGMRGFKGCPLFVHTGHSSLTTTCRAAAGYGNATVERFLGGARHYSTPEIAKANLVAVLTMEDTTKWQAVIDKYGMRHPTPEEVYSMVDRSSSPYWRDNIATGEIKLIISNMTPLERSIVLFGGDMYHLALANEEFAKKFINDLLILNPSTDIVDTKKVLSKLDKTEVAYVFSLCSDQLKGTTLDMLEQNDPAGFQVVGQVAQSLVEVLAKYHDFINVFFAVNHLPPSVGNIRDISRTTSIIADTDSTIFTCQWWVEWMTGHLKRGVIEDRVWYMATYTVCQSIAHNLALMSANIGTERKFINRLSMKNEYGFPVLMNTNQSKTYSALLSIREGNVFDEYEQDLKGVGLRGSTAPKVVLDGIKKLINDILLAIDRGEKLNARETIGIVAQFELDVIRSILKGEHTYLRTEQIKPEGNKMLQFELWQTVFGPKYGMSIDPPIPVVKVSLDLNNKTQLKEWVEGIEDKALAKNMDFWLKKHNRSDLKTVLMPTQVVRSCGMPKELADAANVHKLAYNICTGFYLVLEACGLFIVDRNNYRLAYEFLELEV